MVAGQAARNHYEQTAPVECRLWHKADNATRALIHCARTGRAGIGEHLLQTSLAPLKRFLPEIVPIDFEHVEGEQEHGAVPALRVQPLEVGRAVVAAHHGLAVDRDRADPQGAGGLDDQREAVRPVIAAPSEQAHARADPPHHSR